MDKKFWKATGIRCLRSFLSVILGARTGNVLITEIDWKVTLIAAISATFWIFIACIIAGLPEVDYEKHIHMSKEEPEDSEVEDYEVFDYGDGEEFVDGEE